MRKAHIDYIKNMRSAIGFPGKCLEIARRGEQIEQLIPVCVISSRNVVNNLDARVKNRLLRLPALQNPDGTKSLRYVVRHFKQEYRYQVAFWLRGDAIVSELLSETSAEGLIDLVLRYVSLNQYINDGVPYQIGVDVGASGILSDESGDDIFKAYVEIIFRDGLYEEESVEALSGGTLEIVPPVEIEHL